MSEAMKETYDYYNSTIKLNYPGIVLDPVAESRMLTQLYQQKFNDDNEGDEMYAPKTNT